MKSILFSLTLVSLFILHTACKKANETLPPGFEQINHQVILDWNLAAFEVMGGAGSLHPLLASRVNAMTHIAMHDALNAIVPRYQTYAFHEQDKKADPVAAVSSAAYEVLLASQPAQKPALDSLLAIHMAKVAAGESKTAGIALGKKAAAAILTLRQNDHAFDDPFGPAPPVTDQPGIYQVVPPFDFVFSPQWRTMLPFALEKPEQFRIEAFPSMKSQAYSDAFNEVKLIGQKGSPYRSAEQSAIAKFWYENSDIGWNRVTRVLVTDRKMDLMGTARLFALVNMALADAFTAGWDAKFHHNFWRPYTAIRGAENDGNPNTAADQLWEPAEVTPPIHDYPSTHSALGNAGAAVLARVLGDAVTFTMTSTTSAVPNATRTFTSLSQAADENAESRVLAGIHFRFSCEKGQELGNKVGTWTVDNYLKPLE